MPIRVKALVSAVMVGAIVSLSAIRVHAAHQWIHFFVYLAVILLSSGMKVELPKSEGTMSVNFPFIFLGILQLSPQQAVCLAVCSVIAQCRFRVVKPFTIVQILFNVANVTTATVLACLTFFAVMKLHPESAPALALAATVYFLANTIPLTLVLGWVSNTSPSAHWRQEFLWYLPFYLVGAMLAVLADRIGIHFGWLTSLLLIPLVYTVYRAYCAQMATVRDRERHIREVEALYMRTIEGLSMAIEAKDEGTHEHLMRVRVYVAEMGKTMNLEPAMMQALHVAAFLHDIGKLAVPEHIINKPGKLTPEEFEKMKIHTVVGADILERVKFPYPVVPIIRSHHEAWDGSGYPDGLRGEEIPIGARILTVVDCFDALASERPYRRAMPIEDAMAIVKSRAGTQFDPRIVQLLEDHYPELEKLARQQRSEMEPLRTDIFVERGAAPAAGFESGESGSTETGSTSPIEVGLARQDVLASVANAVRDLNALFEDSRIAAQFHDAGDVCATISAYLRPLIAFDCFAVFRKFDNVAVLVYKDGPCADAFSNGAVAVGAGLSGWVIDSGRPIVNGNPTVETTLLPEAGSFTASSSAVSIPLSDSGGSIFGALTLYSCTAGAFSKEHLLVLQGVQLRLTLALQNATSGLAVPTQDADAVVLAELSAS
ncbi:MAG: HD domain-containing phosphohydrolase [Acidobacteriaceae bacterium]